MSLTRSNQPCLFLDRDGVINADIGYAYQPAQIHFLPGIFELCLYFQQRDFQIIIITNQSGIARGFYTEIDFQQLNHWMGQQFAFRGIKLNAIYHCPHHPSITGQCDCRKPAAGLFLQAIKDHAILSNHSIMIGDKVSDLVAAEKAGISKRYLIAKTKVASHSLITASAKTPLDLLNKHMR